MDIQRILTTWQKKIGKILQIHKRCGPTRQHIYTARVIGEQEIFVQITNWVVYGKNFVGYNELELPRNYVYVAYYSTEEDAVRAVQILCLCELAHDTLNSKGLPSWTEKHIKRLPIDQPTKAVALYERLNNNEKLFGLLYFDTERKCLLIPMDTIENITIPWQKLYFDDLI